MSKLKKSAQPLPVSGIELGCVKAGIKYANHYDLTVIKLAPETHTAAVFTTNQFCAAPVQTAKIHLQTKQPKYLLINTGYANAGMGLLGLQDTHHCCETLAEAANVTLEEVLPFSTGVIGERLPVEKVCQHVPGALKACSQENWQLAAKAIMTTDTKPKIASYEATINGTTVTMTGIAKGAGMIKPNMATMLSFIATDAKVSQTLLQTLLQEAMEESFHAITVDGDTSTNDACVLMATGQSGVAIQSDDQAAHDAFKMLLLNVCQDLAKGVVQDAEGATKLIAVNVTQGLSKAACETIAFTIAHSLLVKTAFFACDPNWGRILAALGRSPGVELNLAKVHIYLNEYNIVSHGERSATYDEHEARQIMQEPEIEIKIELGLGDAQKTVWTSDLSYDYVKINAGYRT